MGTKASFRDRSEKFSIVQKEEPKKEEAPPAEPEVKASGQQSTNGVPPEGAAEPSSVDIEEVQETAPMDT